MSDKHYFASLKEALVEFTKKCRPDMHEPDEQGISATVVGDHLDNAFGEDIRDSDLLVAGLPIPQEFVVVLSNDAGDEFRINLASLIALARAQV